MPLKGRALQKANRSSPISGSAWTCSPGNIRPDFPSAGQNYSGSARPSAGKENDGLSASWYVDPKLGSRIKSRGTKPAT